MAKNDINSNFNQIAVADASDNVLGIRAAIGNLQITGGTSGQVITTNGSGALSWATASSAVTGQRVVFDNGPPDSTWLKAGLSYSRTTYPNLAPLYPSYTATNNAGTVWGWGNTPSIFYGGGRYIAIEASSVAPGAKRTKYSTDGVNWTNGGTLPNITTGQWANLITWNGSVFFVVNYGTGSRIGATSPDGVTWTQRTLPAVVGTQGYYSVASLGTTLVAAEYNTSGTTSQVAVSTDNGATWTTGTIPFTTVDFIAGSSTQLVTGKYGSNLSAYSTNGTTWTLGSTLPASTNWEGAAWNGKHWLMTNVSSNTTAAMSYDGINWFTATLPVSPPIYRPVWNGKMWLFWHNIGGAMYYSCNPQLGWSGLTLAGRTISNTFQVASDGTGNSFIVYDPAQDRVYTYSLTASSTFTIPAGPALSNGGEWFVKS